MDRVVRRLHDRFQPEHEALAQSLTGLPDGADRPAAASLLLHRLMFLRFLEGRGFLAGDRRFLSRRFQPCFYRRFLLPLFRLDPLPGGGNPLAGLAEGPLFQPGPDLDVPDAALERLLAFLDAFDWRLDGQSGAGESAIDPDALGTLFEKHVNQKEIGAYYTKDDITAYIVQNTLLPWLLDRLSADCPAAFAAGGVLRQLLRGRPDSYLAAALGEDAATETARERADRVLRRRTLRHQLRRGKLHAVNDLVTANLDLRRLLLDLIEEADPAVLRSLRQSLDSVTLLDPTAGSGAFLVAALALLDELATACATRQNGQRLNRYQLRRAVLLRNLRGVDQMADAVELCRLRLLLKLAAVAEPGRDRLPVLDKLIRVADALVDRTWADRFDVVVGNPPYLAADRADERVAGFATAGCPDVYAWVMERSASLVRPGGRCGLIVPLSLAFSSRFAPLRQVLFSTFATSWFASFGRIPAALFNFDVRIRNTIFLGGKQLSVCRDPQGSAESVYSTRLHRWFEDERPRLFPLLEYARFRPVLWHGRVPRVGSARLARALEGLIARAAGRLGDSVAEQPTEHVLHFKKTAYNWLTFCRRLPPCYDAAGRAIAQTQFDAWHFRSARLRDLAFLFLNGKWALAWWCIVGDDFHVARWMLADFPIALAGLNAATARRLRGFVAPLDRAMCRAVSFKRNAGKRVGTYNLARCRAVTDRSDRIFGRLLGLTEVWPDVELLCDQVIRTEFAEPLPSAAGSQCSRGTP